jgi:hypothetical protein
MHKAAMNARIGVDRRNRYRFILSIFEEMLGEVYFKFFKMEILTACSKRNLFNLV